MVSPLNLNKTSFELIYIPLILDIPPSPPPPEPQPYIMKKEEILPQINREDESLIEDPKPSNFEESFPPIARVVVMNEQIGEQTKDSSTEAQIAQRLLPSFTPSELLEITKAEMRILSPEQFVNEQQHLLLPETVQSSIDENIKEEITASSADEWDRLMNLASIEQNPNIVNYVKQMINSNVPQIPSLERLSLSEEDELLFFADTEAEEEEPTFEIDLGAFELVDAGISAEELLSNEDPVIYHRDMPVHSVHHDTVQTEAAIQNLMNATQSMLSSQIPPTMVADNYCFAVDADQIQMIDVLGDEHWWKHTSRPTKYFYSEDLRHFYRVNLLTSKGKIISARLANTTPAMGAGSITEMLPPEMTQQQTGGDFGQISSSFSLPTTARRSLTFCTGSAGRPSFAIPSLDPSQIIPPTMPSLSLFPSTSGGFIGRHSIAPFTSSSSTNNNNNNNQQIQEQQSSYAGQLPLKPPEMAQRGESVDLSRVYRVVRFYSFWRTCTSFHRIVTMIERVGQIPTEIQLLQGDPSPLIGQKPTFEIPSSSVQSDKSDSSSAAKSTRPSSSPSKSIPDFQKRRLFVQYLWKNIKSSDKARVQREFDPRRQRLLKCVTDSASRKRMTGAKTHFRSGSAGHSIEKHKLQPTPPNQSPAPRSGGSIRFRLPPSEGSPPITTNTTSTSSLINYSSSNLIPKRLPRPRSSAASPLRRAKTTGEIDDNK